MDIALNIADKFGMDANKATFLRDLNSRYANTFNPFSGIPRLVTMQRALNKAKDNDISYEEARS